MKTILALIDFSDVTPRLLDYAHGLARAFGGEVTLMHVIPPEPVVVDFAPPAVSPDESNARHRDLLALRDSLAARGVNAKAQQFEGPLVETTLAKTRKLNPDIIVMGSHGHGALYNLLVGSVTAGVLKHAAWPVLVIPSAATQQPELVGAGASRTATFDSGAEWGGGF